MKNQNLTIEQQAEDFVDQLGKSIATVSSAYSQAEICKCGQCFCCLVKKFADEAKTDWADPQLAWAK